MLALAVGVQLAAVDPGAMSAGAQALPPDISATATLQPSTGLTLDGILTPQVNNQHWAWFLVDGEAYCDLPIEAADRADPYSCSGEPVSPGLHTVTGVANDLMGTQDSLPSAPVVVDVWDAEPAAAITAPDAAAVLAAQSTITVTGVGPYRGAATVSIDGADVEGCVDLKITDLSGAVSCDALLLPGVSGPTTITLTTSTGGGETAVDTVEVAVRDAPGPPSLAESDATQPDGVIDDGAVWLTAGLSSIGAEREHRITVFVADDLETAYCTLVVPVGSLESVVTAPCPTLPVGTTDLVAVADDGELSSAASEPWTITVYGTAGIGDLRPTVEDDLGDGSGIVVSGTGPALGTVSVQRTGGDTPPQLACQAAAVSIDGSWSCTLPFALPTGTSTIAITAFDLDGVPVDATTQSLTVTVQPPAVQIVGGAGTFSALVTGATGATIEADLYRVGRVGGPSSSASYTFAAGQTCSALSPASCTVADARPEVTGTLVWNVWVHQIDGESQSDNANVYVLVGSTPSISAEVTATDGAGSGTVRLSGAIDPPGALGAGEVGEGGGGGEVDQAVDAVALGGTVAVRDADGALVCSTTLANGSWSCDITTASGSHAYRAQLRPAAWTADPDGDSAAIDATVVVPSAWSGWASVEIAAEVVTPAATATTEPTAAPTPTATPRAPLTWDFGITGTGRVRAGETRTITAEGLPVGSTIVIELHSTPIELARAVVGDDGRVSLVVRIPSTVDAGDHTIVAILTEPDGTVSTVERAVVVEAPDAVADDAGAATTEAAASGIAGEPSGGRSDGGAPSGVTGTIPSFMTIVTSPGALIGAAIGGLGLLFLVAIPSELLGRALAEQHDRVVGGLARLPLGRIVLGRWARGRLAVATWVRSLVGHPVATGIGVVLATSVVFGFSDPAFGFDLVSLRLVLSSAVALGLVSLVAGLIAGGIVERRWRLTWSIEVKPLGVLLAAFGVLVGRLLDLSPGIFIGLLLGVAVAGRIAPRLDAAVALVSGAVVLAISLMTWVAVSLWGAALASDGGFFSALVADALVIATAEGLTALTIGLLPLRWFEGAALWRVSKPLWAGAFIVAAAIFTAVVVPDSGGSFDDLGWHWLVALGGFAIAAVVVYLVLHRVSGDEHGDEHGDEDADGDGDEANAADAATPAS